MTRKEGHIDLQEDKFYTIFLKLSISYPKKVTKFSKRALTQKIAFKLRVVLPNPHHYSVESNPGVSYFPGGEFRPRTYIYWSHQSFECSGFIS